MTATSPNTKYDHSNELDGIHQGDPVSIKGERGVYTFHQHTRNTENGQEWATVYGGSKDPNAQRQYRSCPPDQIRRAK